MLNLENFWQYRQQKQTLKFTSINTTVLLPETCIGAVVVTTHAGISTSYQWNFTNLFYQAMQLCQQHITTHKHSTHWLAYKQYKIMTECGEDT